MTTPHLPPDRESRHLLEQLDYLSPTAAAIFLQQWGEIRGTWEREDWDERIRLTIAYWEKLSNARS